MGTHYTNVTEIPILMGCDRVLHGVPKTLNEKPTTPSSGILGPWAWPESPLVYKDCVESMQPVLLLSAAWSLARPCSVPLTRARSGREVK